MSEITWYFSFFSYLPLHPLLQFYLSGSKLQDSIFLHDQVVVCCLPFSLLSCPGLSALMSLQAGLGGTICVLLLNLDRLCAGQAPYLLYSPSSPSCSFLSRSYKIQLSVDAQIKGCFYESHLHLSQDWVPGLGEGGSMEYFMYFGLGDLGWLWYPGPGSQWTTESNLWAQGWE